MSLPDFLVWHCAGCGAAAEGKKKPCDCATNVGTREGPGGKLETTWWAIPAMSDLRDQFIEWYRHAYGTEPSEMEWTSNSFEGSTFRSIVEWLSNRSVQERPYK